MKIAMLISGGVDSSVSLRLLRDSGHDITAFYLKIWLEDELAFLGECPWEDDLKYVRAVCEEAGVPLRIANLQKEYWDEVVSYVIAEAKAGRTPNPDILCNSRIKFGMFYDRFGKDFDRVATGHYAQTELRDFPKETFSTPPRLINSFGYRKNSLPQRQPEEFFRTGNIFSDRKERAEKILSGNPSVQEVLLKKSPDPIKDQTYFLSQLSQAQVNKALFPIGGFQKSEVRELAKKYKLPNAARKDSQGICFLGQVAFDKFLEHYLGTKEGDIVDLKTGKVFGTHKGYWFHTIGQRRGLGLSGGPWYVASKDIGDNTVFVSNEWRSEEMARDSFIVSRLNWISGKISGKKNLSVKLRHGPKEYPCEVKFLDDERLEVKLDGFDRGIAPGQFAVFYDGKYCLGGGVIV
ncbi:MAG: tRNA 2-thiouridine(34) synthase MnmA [Candidatus Moranbacteria bacterium]|nr:tRNA 2-thiouridine(34) synthase MnmA [Candidatus Moranbacteria bacterium]